MQILKKEESELPVGAISIKNLSKSFRKASSKQKTYSSLKSELLGGRKSRETSKMQVLKDVNLEIKPGQAVALIGTNGSGKSSLLKIIAGIYKADTGSVEKNGKVSALIELGAGFHPDFSGRENIYLAGIMYGLTRKEIDALFEEIVEYAELENFIDDPIKTYSSGMYMRLGFSVAIHTNPDILLVDEVLAVGDAAFVSKCRDSVGNFIHSGKTLVLVSHDLDAVSRWCKTAVWLERGVVKEIGESKSVINSYLSFIDRKREEQLEKENKKKQRWINIKEGQDYDLRFSENNRWGNGLVELSEIRLKGEDGKYRWVFDPDESIEVEVDYEVKEEIDDLVFGVGITRPDGLDVFGANTEIDEIDLVKGREKILPQKGTYKVKFERIGLVDGAYYLDIAAHRKDGMPYDYQHLLHKFSVRGERKCSGVYAAKVEWDVGDLK